MRPSQKKRTNLRSSPGIQAASRALRTWRAGVRSQRRRKHWRCRKTRSMSGTENCKRRTRDSRWMSCRSSWRSSCRIWHWLKDLKLCLVPVLRTSMERGLMVLKRPLHSKRQHCVNSAEQTVRLLLICHVTVIIRSHSGCCSKPGKHSLSYVVIQHVTFLFWANMNVNMWFQCFSCNLSFLMFWVT